MQNDTMTAAEALNDPTRPNLPRRMAGETWPQYILAIPVGLVENFEPEEAQNLENLPPRFQNLIGSLAASAIALVSALSLANISVSPAPNQQIAPCSLIHAQD